MAGRVKLDDERGPFVGPRNHIPTFPSGSIMLDQVNGGGWALHKVINLVGDESTGKTLLAIEGATNFLSHVDNSRVFYVEAEAAFDEDYARFIGLPDKGVDVEESIDTIEKLERFLQDRADEKDGQEKLIIVDSLDALSDEAEMVRDIGKGTYGGDKPKQISTMFRKNVRRMAASNMTLMIISQTRDKIGMTFGSKKTFSGGRALRFYASQQVWLAHLKQLLVQRRGIKRPCGVKVAAKNKKNKIGPPFRDCTFDIHFEFGIDDVGSALDWLIEVKEYKRLYETKADAQADSKGSMKLTRDEWTSLRDELHVIVPEVWAEIETEFRVGWSKY